MIVWLVVVITENRVGLVAVLQMSLCLSLPLAPAQM